MMYRERERERVAHLVCNVHVHYILQGVIFVVNQSIICFLHLYITLQRWARQSVSRLESFTKKISLPWPPFLHQWFPLLKKKKIVMWAESAETRVYILVRWLARWGGRALRIGLDGSCAWMRKFSKALSVREKISRSGEGIKGVGRDGLIVAVGHREISELTSKWKKKDAD